MKSDAQARATLRDLIRDIRVAMFTTRHADGHLHSRPMTTQHASIDDDDRLWFFMSRRHETVVDLQRTPAVNVTYADTDGDRYVSISGEARVVDDADRRHALWSPVTQAWFPGGADDPDVVLVCVRILHADTWKVNDNKLTQVLRLARAAVTGTPPAATGEHAHLDWRSSAA